MGSGGCFLRQFQAPLFVLDKILFLSVASFASLLKNSIVQSSFHLCLHLRGPAAILFISRNACSDSNAKMFGACFCGAHNCRAICCKMGSRTDVPV